MKKILFFIFIFLSIKSFGQTYSQTFIDKCSGEKKIATTTMINGYATVSFYSQVRTFTPLEVQTGIVQTWLMTTKATYEALTCPVINNPVVQQTVANAVAFTTSGGSAADTSGADLALSTVNQAGYYTGTLSLHARYDVAGTYTWTVFDDSNTTADGINNGGDFARTFSIVVSGSSNTTSAVGTMSAVNTSDEDKPMNTSASLIASAKVFSLRVVANSALVGSKFSRD